MEANYLLPNVTGMFLNNGIHFLMKDVDIIETNTFVNHSLFTTCIFKL